MGSFSHHRGCPFSPASLVACHNVAGCFRVPPGDRPLQCVSSYSLRSACRSLVHEPNWHWRVPAGWLQKEIPFRINSPTKTCAVARSFVMSSILHFNFYLQRRKVKARRGGCTSIHG